MFVSFPGALDENTFVAELMKTDSGGKLPRYKRFFCKEDEMFRINGATYALPNQWGDRTLEAVSLLAQTYPKLNVEVKSTAESAGH